MSDSLAAPPSLLAIPAAADASSQIALHRGWLRRVEELAENLTDRGRDEDAIAAAGIGALFALFAHPGVMASPRLERVFARVAGRSLTQVPRAVPAASPPSRVLHVVTETYATGGHTRVLWRWIERDRHRTHDVVATHQTGDLPDGLKKAVRGAGGRVVALSTKDALLARAQALRALAAEADIIVLHTHTYDPIPSLAFCGMEHRPPTIMHDHATGVFWFGRTVADLVVGGLESMPAPTARRRIPAERYISAPFPVTGTDGHGRDPATPLPELTRSLARSRVLRALGWPKDTVLLFTAGDGYKYNGPSGSSLLDLVEPVLARCPSARLLAVGAEHQGQWEQVAERTGGRVRALGKRTGIGTFYAAADIYLDSYPFGGNGSSAEAASHGLPVISCATTALEAEFCRAQPFFGAHQQSDVGQYHELLQVLIGDPAERGRLGEQSRLAVATTEATWNARLEEVYARAAELGAVDVLADPGDEPEPVDVLVHLLTEATGKTARADYVEPVLALLELAGRSDEIRELYGSLCGPTWRPVLLRRWASAFAVPSADSDALRGLIADFATMVGAGIVTDRLVIGMRPQDADDAAIAVLEQALASHPQLTVDLILASAPESAKPPGALEVLAA